MSEKNILAYFKTSEQAQKAEQALKQLGVSDTQIDEFGRYPGEGIDRLMSPLTGETDSNARLTLGLNQAGRDTRILALADPSASGLSDGDDMITGHNYLLTAVVDENQHHLALAKVREEGGWV